MANLIKSTSFADRELTSRDKWWFRVWKIISDELHTRIGDDSWTTFSLPSGVTEFGSGFTGHGYRMLQGVVYFYGVLSAVGKTSPFTICTLPTAYRPATLSYFVVSGVSSTGVGRISINPTTGVVQYDGSFDGNLSSQDRIGLSKIIFLSAGA